MSKFRKKPVVIDAVQWTGKNVEEIHKFIGEGGQYNGGVSFQIFTLEGDHTANKGDWVIKGIKGEFYPCKPDIFDATYEAVGRMQA